MLRKLASTLARLHLAGWQRGCCYPKHIFIKVNVDLDDIPQTEIALIDLEQLARHCGNIPRIDLWSIQQAHQQELAGPYRA